MRGTIGATCSGNRENGEAVVAVVSLLRLREIDL
jgi:hypothetical protein